MQWRAMRVVLSLLTIFLGMTLKLEAQQANPGAVSVGRAFELPIDPAKFVGVVKCADCHSMPNPLRSTDWVRLTEFAQWRDHDKHALAFKQLTTPRAKQMGKVLYGIEDVTGRQECLSCHANWVHGADKPMPINLQEGVACESCHGPGADYLLPHADAAWRTKSNEQKRALGMVNVRDPRERARQCLSCHIGNAEEGKLLTHDMYAAGHPPLPSIEIETFAQKMPPHWRTLNQKVADLAKLSPPKQLPDLAKIRELLAQPDGQLHGVKSVLVGGIMNYRESLHLLGQQAASQRTKDEVDAKAVWPEFAAFDCAMCHHELQTPSWRQARMLSGKLTPGRPQAPRWPSALIDAALTRAADGEAEKLIQLRDEFADRQTGLQSIFNKSPFGIGRGDEIAAASGELVGWLDGLVDRVSQSKYDRAAAEGVMVDLARSAQKDTIDYDSARQVAWALRTIWHELNPSGDDSPVSQSLAELTKTLRLDLPWGRTRQILDPQEQQAALAAVTSYDPIAFQKQMARIAASLAQPPSSKK